VCKALCHGLSHGSVLCLFGYLVRIFGQNFSEALLEEVFQFFPNFLAALQPSESMLCTGLR
jgi:hypothetical protein